MQGGIILTAFELITAACSMQGLTLSELAERYGTTQQNLRKRALVGKFSLDEWEKIAAALGGSLVFQFKFSDGNGVKTIGYFTDT